MALRVFNQISCFSLLQNGRNVEKPRGYFSTITDNRFNLKIAKKPKYLLRRRNHTSIFSYPSLQTSAIKHKVDENEPIGIPNYSNAYLELRKSTDRTKLPEFNSNFSRRRDYEIAKISSLADNTYKNYREENHVEDPQINIECGYVLRDSQRTRIDYQKDTILKEVMLFNYIKKRSSLQPATYIPFKNKRLENDEVAKHLRKDASGTLDFCALKTIGQRNYSTKLLAESKLAYHLIHQRNSSTKGSVEQIEAVSPDAEKDEIVVEKKSSNEDEGEKTEINVSEIMKDVTFQNDITYQGPVVPYPSYADKLKQMGRKNTKDIKTHFSASRNSSGLLMNQSIQHFFRKTSNNASLNQQHRFYSSEKKRTKIESLDKFDDAICVKIKKQYQKNPDCQCIEPLTATKMPKLHRLQENFDSYLIEPTEAVKPCIPICPEPRADDDKNLYKKKCLPKVSIGDCPCVEPEQPDFARPLPRLYKRPIFEQGPIALEECKVECERTPRADDTLQEKQKQLKPFKLLDCPCRAPPVAFTAPPLRMPVKKISICDAGNTISICVPDCPAPRADDGKDLIKKKCLPAYKRDSCPCKEPEPLCKGKPLVRPKKKVVRFTTPECIYVCPESVDVCIEEEPVAKKKLKPLLPIPKASPKKKYVPMCAVDDLKREYSTMPRYSTKVDCSDEQKSTIEEALRKCRLLLGKDNCDFCNKPKIETSRNGFKPCPKLPLKCTNYKLVPVPPKKKGPVCKYCKLTHSVADAACLKNVDTITNKQCKGSFKALLCRFINYFKARPGCPAPDEWKKKQLRERAEKAAKAAGLELCEPIKPTISTDICQKPASLCKPKKPSVSLMRMYSRYHWVKPEITKVINDETQHRDVLEIFENLLSTVKCNMHEGPKNKESKVITIYTYNEPMTGLEALPIDVYNGRFSLLPPNQIVDEPIDEAIWEETLQAIKNVIRFLNQYSNNNNYQKYSEQNGSDSLEKDLDLLLNTYHKKN